MSSSAIDSNKRMIIALGNHALPSPRYAVCTISWSCCQLREFFRALSIGNASENYFSLWKSQCINAHPKVVLLIALESNLNWNALMRKSSRCLEYVLARTELFYRVAWIRHRTSFCAIDRNYTAAKHPPWKTGRAINKHGSYAVTILGFGRLLWNIR